MTRKYGKDIPKWLRIFRCYCIEGQIYRFNWGEFTFTPGLALRYSVYHEQAHLNIQLPVFFDLHLKVPMVIKQQQHTEDWNASYGFSTFEKSIHLNWRTRCKIIYLPWDWGSCIRHSVFLKDGSRAPWKSDGNDGRHIEKHPYKYVLNSGLVQHGNATVYGLEMEWRWRWFPWLPWPRKISRSIDIEFDRQIGEYIDSWKGGCTGCEYEWRNNETMLEALRRMESERKF